MKNTKKKGNNFVKVLKNIFKKLGSLIKRINKKVILAVVCVLIIIFLINLFKPKSVDYPVIFNDSDGDLYLVTKKVNSKDKAVKLASGEATSKVKYANNTDRYVLFQKEESLYLYDAKKKDETKKVLNSVAGSNYFFSDDDKYVIALDDKGTLKVFDFKETKKIESSVTKIVEIKGDHILYEKEGVTYIRNLKPSKDKTEKVTETGSSNIRFSEDGKNVLYINSANELHMYNVKKNKDKKIANSVNSYYCDDSSCEKLMYIAYDEVKHLYYFDGKKDVELVDEIFSVLATDIADKQVVYLKANGNKFEIYYQKGTKTPAKIDEGLDGVKSVKLLDNDVYYVTSNNKLKYAKISGAKISRKLTVSSDVFGYLYEYKNGFAYITNIDDYYNGNLYIAKGGKAKKIAENVGSSTIKVNKNGKRIYYIKDFGNEGELYYTKGGKGKFIESKVYSYEYVKDNLIYILRDYTVAKAKGDLYRYTNKSVKIADNVFRMANSPVSYVRK